MASITAGRVGQYLGRLFGNGNAIGLTDGELLERFAHQRDEAAEGAFETLLDRHGAMVLTVCRQVLGDPHAAEDAFQATFLVLVRRASSLRFGAPGSLGPWLYGVAFRTALKARQGTRRCRAREKRASASESEKSSVAVEQNEFQALLHQEINGLPEKYRAVVVLCYFEGRTHEEAAAQFGWPIGTVKGRLARARDLLRARLSRRGLAPEGWTGASFLGVAPRVVPSALLLDATLAVTVKGTPVPVVAAMAELTLRALLVARLKLTAIVLSLLVLMGGFGLVLRAASARLPQQRSGSDSTSVTATQPTANRSDRPDDSLPEHARVRLGGNRFHQGTSLYQALYSPDGKSLVALDSQGGVGVWEAATGRMIRTIGGPPNRFRQVALSPDGRTLATVEDPGRLRLWDLASGRELRRWLEFPETSIKCLTFSPDGRTLAAEVSTYIRATKKVEHVINLWDLTSPTEHRRRFVADWIDLAGLAFSPDGKTLVSGSNDTESRTHEIGSTRLWDVTTGRERARFPVAGCHVSSLALSPDGRLLATGVTDSTIRIYDLTTRQERTLRLGQNSAAQLKAQAFSGAGILPAGAIPSQTMNCLAFSPDGSILASGTSGTGNTTLSSLADVYLWDVAQGKELRHLPAHQSWLNSLGFSPDGRTLASTGPEPMIRLWDVATGREAFPQHGHRSWIRDLAISPVDGTAFTNGQDGTIRHWDPASGRELGIIASFAGRPDAMVIAPDGKSLLVGGNGVKFGLWSIADRRLIRSFPRIEPRNPMRFVAFSPDGKTVASEGQIWDTASGRVMATFRDRDERNNRWAYLPTFYSSDGKQLITVGTEGVRIWDIASGREARWVVRGKISTSAALSHDGRYLATSGLTSRSEQEVGDAPVHLWELASGQQVATLGEHEEASRCLTFSPDDRFLAAGGMGDGMGKNANIRVWDLVTGRELRRFSGHQGAVNAVAFTLDGHSVISGSEDATALVWDLSDLKDAPSTAPSITADIWKARWEELADDDARVAYRAGWALSIPTAVPFLREQLRPAALPAPEGVPAADGPIAPPEVLQTLRAIAALERVGTPEARSVLERMAQGNPSAIQTRDAKSALERLGRLTKTQAGSSTR